MANPLNLATFTELQQTETQQSVLTSVQQEMASRRSKLSFSRQDSRLSVKTLIESIENNKQVELMLNTHNVQPLFANASLIIIILQQGKTDETESHYSSTSSLNSGTPEAGNTPIILPGSSDWHESVSCN